jgi:hypothetical protein
VSVFQARISSLKNNIAGKRAGILTAVFNFGLLNVESCVDEIRFQGFRITCRALAKVGGNSNSNKDAEH